MPHSSLTAKSSSKSGDEADDVQWKRLVVSRDTTFTGQLSCSPLFLSATCNDTNSRATESEVERRPSTLLHSGGDRDYHTMHYVLSSADDEKTQGMRVLVIGSVVVASEEDAAQCGRGTQAQESAANAAMAFQTLTLRVEELRVRQSCRLWQGNKSLALCNEEAVLGAITSAYHKVCRACKTNCVKEANGGAHKEIQY
ncbi:unnamed protein product [Peronospora destructor]|uniref:Uncharacterized protein n=1 Tax=Peronospora destructor TaxID=86335 RepID=A0AAV0T2N6_9STRA|nr:unnamed protein product [Peronospora destructor]